MANKIIRLSEDLNCSRRAHAPTKEGSHSIIEKYEKAFDDKEDLVAKGVKKGARIKQLENKMESVEFSYKESEEFEDVCAGSFTDGFWHVDFQAHQVYP